MSETDGILEILGEAKRLAQEYRRLTGKPLGITGEVAEYEAARILGVELTPAKMKFAPAVRGRRWGGRTPGGICAWCTSPTKKGMVCLW